MLTGEQARAVLAKIMVPRNDLQNLVATLAKDQDEQVLYEDFCLALRGLDFAFAELMRREEQHV